MIDNRASHTALEMIILARAKQQAYQMLAETATDFTAEYWEKSNEAYKIMLAQIEMARETGLLKHQDCDVWAIKLVETGATEEK